MDMVDFTCHKCGHLQKIPAAYIHRHGMCTNCGAPFVVEEVAHGRPGSDPDVEVLARQVSKALDHGESVHELMDAVTLAFFALPECAQGGKAVLFLLDEAAGGLRLVRTRGQFSPEFLESEAFVPLGQCLCGRAAQSGQILICNDCFTDPRHENRWLGMKSHGHYVIPLKHGGHVTGILTVYTQAGVFADKNRLASLAALGERIGAGIARFARSDSLAQR